MRWPALALLLLLVVTACADGSGETTITIFAASSLTGPFTQIGEDYEAEHPGVEVEFNFGSSSDLADSIVSGDALGTADVFASADEANVQKLVRDAAAAAEPVPFAQNQAQLAVPSGNPGDVEGLDDLADDDLLVGLCAEDVPCGAYAREVLANAGVEASVDTNEAKVTDVVDKLISGDLDVGIVYVSDVVANEGELQGIEIPDDVNVLADYPIVPVADSEHPDEAEAFVAYVQTPEARQVLEDAGFLIPLRP